MSGGVARLGLQLPAFAPEPVTDWQHVLDYAIAADQVGLHRVAASDHVVFGEDLDAYSRPELGGMAGGRQPTGPDGYWLEPMTVLAAVSAVTTRVRLTTTVLLAALRRPVVLAKSAATLDVLSRGRLDLGIGVGWQREEYVAAGLDFGARGRLLDQSVDVMQALWREPRASYHGTRLDFDAIHMMPKPAQDGGVPIWVSGTLNERVLARLARYASGWIPWGDWLSDPGPGIRVVHERLRGAGREPAGFGVLVTLPRLLDGDGTVDLAATLEPAGALAEAGVTDFRTALPLPDEHDAKLEVLARAMDRFRLLTGSSGA